MALQDIIRWLLPREDVFYRIIEELSTKVEGAARALLVLETGAPPEQVFEAVRAIEGEADKLVFEAEEQFARVFVTPIDREDLQALIVSIDDIIDLIYLSSRAFVIYGVPKPTTAMIEQMRLLVTLGELLCKEIPALARHEYERLIELGRTIRVHEKAGDKVFREAVGAMFHDDAIDAKVLFRDKEVLEDLENAIDKFELVAERLKNLAVKHG